MSRIDDLKKLVKEHYRHLQKLKEQHARFGILYTPTHILIDIEDREAEIYTLQEELTELYKQEAHNDAQGETLTDFLKPVNALLAAGDWSDYPELIPSENFYQLTWLSPVGRRILEIALGESLRIGHFWLGVEFLLMGLSKQQNTTLQKLLQEIGIPPDEFRARLRGAVEIASTQNWKEQDSADLGKKMLPNVCQVLPDLLPSRFEKEHGSLMVITPRLITILNDAAEWVGQGKIGHKHLLWMIFYHRSSLSLLLLFNEALKTGWTPEKVISYLAEFVGQPPENLKKKMSDFVIDPPHLEILSGPLDGHIIALKDEIFWSKDSHEVLSFPWDVELGTPQARFFYKDRQWWIESYSTSSKIYCFNRREFIDGKFQLNTGDILRAHNTWMLVRLSK